MKKMKKMKCLNPPLHLICQLTGRGYPRYIRINSSGVDILVEGYANIFQWNSIEFLICEVETGAVPLTAICAFKK